MLALLMVASGCLGSGSSEPLTPGEEEVGSTVNYWNNTTVIHWNNTTVIHWDNTTTVIQDAPNYIAINGRAEWPEAHLSINQSAGEATNLLSIHTDYTTSRVTFVVYTNCTGGWQFEGFVTTSSAHPTLASDTPKWLAGEGLECTHDIRTAQGTNEEQQVTAIYLQVPVTVV
jgi:hypothetical protein